MSYDFDAVIQRRGTDSLKWAVPENELPMWVADMDYPAAPEICAALQKRLAHGVFGYSVIPEGWYDAYIRWWDRRHGLQLARDWLLFCAGVVPAISAILRELAAPGENVVLQTPVYNAFFHCVKESGCRVLESPLNCRDGAYSMDLPGLERAFAEPQTKWLLLCNPHNPTGNIWGRETLAQVGALAKKHGVTVISDEIHCDLTAPGRSYVPFASVSEDCREVSLTCIAPTKAFNLAGLHTAAVCVPEPRLRQRVRAALDGVSQPNTFACTAAQAAFDEGGPWLDALRRYVFENRRLAEEFIARELPQLQAVHGQATYLLWIGLPFADGRRFADELRKTTGLFLTPGEIYGKNGSRFLRMNLACPRSVLNDGLQRLRRGVLDYRD